MDCQSSSFENMIQSFKSVCSTLENNAESDLMNMEKQCRKEFFESAKTLEKFNELSSVIDDTCKEILNCSEILNLHAKDINPESVIYIPYEIHSGLVNSISVLYNMLPLGKADCNEKLISEKSKQLVSDIIKECEKNIYDMREIQTSVAEAKSHFKAKRFSC